MTSARDDLPMQRGALALLQRRDFGRLFFAISISELGDAFHYIALMWLALDKGGPLGVVAVRLADSVPALFFGLHGGIAADRWDRRRLMVGADLVRGATLIPLAVAGLSGSLTIWELVVAAFVLEAATSYFEPAYGATVPAIVDRENVQGANALVAATSQGLGVGGWAVGAALLAVLPLSTFFAVDAASFLVSAALLVRLRTGRARSVPEETPRLGEGFAAVRPRRALLLAICVFAAAMTIATGSWIAGVPIFIRDTLGRGAGGFSIVMIGFAVGSIASGALLAHVRVRSKSRARMLAWLLYLPAYGLLAAATSLPLVVLAAVGAGAGESFAYVLLNSAAQEQIPDRVLGRVLGLISFVHRGSHALGLLLIAPLYAVADARPLFAAAAVAVPLAGVAGAAAASRSGRLEA